jgi:hypothetical protein
VQVGPSSFPFLLRHFRTFADTQALAYCSLLVLVLILDVLKCTDDEEQDTAAAAHALAPCIHHRMGSIPCTETAEELRLLLLQLLEFLWSRPSASTWGAEVADETAEVLTCALLDTFPEVKRHSCTLLSLMAGVPAGRTSLKHRTDKLLQVLASNLSHQHSKTRQMTVEGMGDVLLCGGDGADKVRFPLFWFTSLPHPAGSLTSIASHADRP